MDIAHIISSHFRFDLMEMYLLIKQRLNCIGNLSSVKPLSHLSGIFIYVQNFTKTNFKRKYFLSVRLIQRIMGSLPMKTGVAFDKYLKA